MQEDYKHIVFSKNVIEVITVANDICIFLEEFDSFELNYSLLYLQKALPLLYLKSALLPDIENNHKEANERFITQEQWEDIFVKANSKLGNKDTFYMVDEVSNKAAEVLQSSIAECLADIYQDLKDFLLLYQKNTITAQENAVYFTKILFETHWGAKLINVHSAIHSLIYKSYSSTSFLSFSAN